MKNDKYNTPADNVSDFKKVLLIFQSAKEVEKAELTSRVVLACCGLLSKLDNISFSYSFELENYPERLAKHINTYIGMRYLDVPSESRISITEAGSEKIEKDISELYNVSYTYTVIKHNLPKYLELDEKELFEKYKKTFRIE